MSGVGRSDGLQRTPSFTGSRPAEGPVNTPPKNGALSRQATPEDMPSGRRSSVHGSRPQVSTTLPPSRQTHTDPITSAGTDLAMTSVGAVTSTGPGHVAESAADRTLRETQEQAQQQLVLYAKANAEAMHAIGQNGVAVAGNTLTTFGVGVTAGDQGASDLVANSKLIEGLLKNYKDSPGLQAAAKGAQLGAGWAAGGGLGAIASVFGQVVASPVLTGIAQSLGGTQAKFDKVPVDHLVPLPDPGKFADPAAYQTARANVMTLRAEITERQNGFGLNTARGVGVGSASFVAGHGARAGAVDHTNPHATLGARVGNGSMASGGAGALTGAALAAMQAAATVSVDIDGVPHDLPLFKASASSINRGDVLQTIVGNVGAAAKKFSPNGLSFQEIARELSVQLPLRAAGIMGATAVNYGVRTGAAALNAHIGEDPTKNGAVDAAAAMLAYVCAVGFWFHALPKIQGIHPSPRPEPAPPGDQGAPDNV